MSNPFDQFDDKAPPATTPNPFDQFDQSGGAQQRGVSPPAPGGSPPSTRAEPPGALDRYWTTVGKGVLDIPRYVSQGMSNAVDSLAQRLERAKRGPTSISDWAQKQIDLPMAGIDALNFLTRPIFGPVERGVSALTGDMISPEDVGYDLMALGPEGGGPRPVPRGAVPPPRPPGPPPGGTPPPAASAPVRPPAGITRTTVNGKTTVTQPPPDLSALKAAANPFDAMEGGAPPAAAPAAKPRMTSAGGFSVGDMAEGDGIEPFKIDGFFKDKKGRLYAGVEGSEDAHLISDLTPPVGAATPAAGPKVMNTATPAAGITPPAGGTSVPPGAGAGAPPTTGAPPPGGGTPPPAGGGRPPFAGPATNPPPLPPSVVEGARSLAKNFERIFSPTTVDENAQFAEALIRDKRGTNLRKAEQERAALDQFNSEIRTMNEPQQLDFIDYIETRSQPGGPRTGINPALQPVADALRATFKKVETELANLPATTKMSFIQDYFPHFWEDPAAVQRFMSTRGVAKEGSGGFTKAREIPTIAEGLAAGLRLKSVNPLEATMQYVDNAYRFIAQGQVFAKAKEIGLVKSYIPGKQPDGYMELTGRFGGKLTPAGQMRAYAPEGFARVYNNAISREMTGPHGDIIRAAQQASNGWTAAELGLSYFHGMTMAQEAMVNSFASALKSLGRGKPLTAAADIIKAPGAPISYALTGGKMQRAYKGIPAKGPIEKFGDYVSPGAQKIDKLTQLLARAGGRAAKMEQGYLASRQGSYVKAWKRGTLKTEALADWRDIKGRPVTGTASVVARHIARIMDTFSQPLFQEYIPRLKDGAFAKNMQAWLDRNPGATEGDQLAAAREIWDTVDNRFGEMVRDNIFWDNRIKQAMQIGLRSFTWAYGSGREIAGGAWDTGKLAWKSTQEAGRRIQGLPKAPAPGATLRKASARNAFRDYLGTASPSDPKVTQRMAYIVALPMLYAIWNGVAQYMYTGIPPENMQDLMAARTGGKDAATGRDERITAPGYMKDVLGWSTKGFFGELYNKMATLPRLALELARNRDWRNMPIAPEGNARDPRAPSWLQAYFDYVLENMGPFGMKQIARGQKRGSAITPVATFLGFQPAGRSLTDPAGYERMHDRAANKSWRNKTRADHRDAQRYKGPD